MKPKLLLPLNPSVSLYLETFIISTFLVFWGSFYPKSWGMKYSTIVLLELIGIQDYDPVIAKSCVQGVLFITVEKENM